VEKSKDQEVIVVETTVIGIEFTEKNGKVCPNIGLAVRGDLPEGFKPIIAKEMSSGIRPRRNRSSAKRRKHAKNHLN
jgi:hypothetical protein